MVLSDDRLWELWNAQGTDDMSKAEAFHFARQIEAEARRDALEDAAKVCEAMHEEDRPGDYAYAIRALKETIK